MSVQGGSVAHSFVSKYRRLSLEDRSDNSASDAIFSESIRTCKNDNRSNRSVSAKTTSEEGIHRGKNIMRKQEDKEQGNKGSIEVVTTDEIQTENGF